jgi:small subunit ribosomal protein S6
MTDYEMMYILRPDISEDQVQQEVGKYRDFLAQYNSEEIQIKLLGKRRLAYPIKRYQDGIYVQMNYQANGKQVAPLERAMRLSDEVIRFLTIKLSDKVKEEVAPAKTEAVVAPALVS